MKRPSDGSFDHTALRRNPGRCLLCGRRPQTLWVQGMRGRREQRLLHGDDRGPGRSFMMGSTKTEKGHRTDEEPQRMIRIEKPLAPSRFALTFDEWDTCADHGDYDPQISDGGWGCRRRPVINVTWNDAQRYVAWLKRMTGKDYRLVRRKSHHLLATGAVVGQGDTAITSQLAGNRWTFRSAARACPTSQNRLQQRRLLAP
jgi:formylglycine-generating enzyme required for sulfatase activity